MKQKCEEYEEGICIEIPCEAAHNLLQCFEQVRVVRPN